MAKTLGGSGDDFANAAIGLSDGSFVIAGYVISNDGDVSGNHGAEDVWVIKIDSGGKLLWQKTFGGSFRDVGNDIAMTLDGGFVVAGQTGSSDDGDVGGSQLPRLLGDPDGCQWEQGMVKGYGQHHRRCGYRNNHGF